MKKRTIQRAILSQTIQMGNIQLKQPLPLQDLAQVAPFLLLHHSEPLLQEAGGINVIDVGPT